MLIKDWKLLMSGCVHGGGLEDSGKEKLVDVIRYKWQCVCMLNFSTIIYSYSVTNDIAIGSF